MELMVSEISTLNMKIYEHDVLRIMAIYIIMRSVWWNCTVLKLLWYAMVDVCDYVEFEIHHCDVS